MTYRDFEVNSQIPSIDLTRSPVWVYASAMAHKEVGSVNPKFQLTYGPTGYILPHMTSPTPLILDFENSSDYVRQRFEQMEKENMADRPTDEELIEAYDRLWDEPAPIAQSIAEEYGVSYSTAVGWIEDLKSGN